MTARHPIALLSLLFMGFASAQAFAESSNSDSAPQITPVAPRITPGITPGTGTEINSTDEHSFESFYLKYLPERRTNPSSSEAGFFFFPIYSHLPGTGSTGGAGLLERNILHSRANLVVASTFGDLSVATIGVSEIHAVKDRLIFGTYLYSATVPSQFFDRGSRADKKDFFSDDQKSYGGSASGEFHLFERRLQLLTQVGGSRNEQLRIRDSSGAHYSNLDSREYASINNQVRLRLDLTDDFYDPRRGIRADLSRSEADLFDSNHSRFANWSFFGTAYLPVGRSSTWAFNFSRASSFVYDSNLKSAAALKAELGLNCQSQTDADRRLRCQHSEGQRVRDQLAENRYGTVAPLGGSTQLRGYPAGRLRGSSSVFYGTELRYNLTDENTPFDFLFINGSRSVVQVALFYEMGAASDPPNSVLNEPFLAAYGVGFRLGFSGALVRADLGFGSEGSQFTFFFGYPWEPSLF